MRLTVVGCSPAWPNPGGAQSGYLVETDGGRLLLDCGPGVLSRLRAGGGWPTVEAIVISHLHLDHFGDLVSWVWGADALAGRGESTASPELWLPPGGAATLERFAAILGTPGMFERVFQLREYAPAAAFVAAGATLHAARVPHFDVEACALRVEAGGRSLVYSGDSAPSSALAELAYGADLLLCEATLAHPGQNGDPRGHLAAEEAVALADSAGVHALLLTHRASELPVPPGLDVALDGLVREI